MKHLVERVVHAYNKMQFLKKNPVLTIADSLQLRCLQIPSRISNFPIIRFLVLMH